MTENKRFALAYETNDQNCIWWAVRDGDITLWKEEVVGLLNELYEENEQSKMMIATLRNIVLENEDLEKENKELKEENEQLKHDATVLICSNQEYRKENEQLKERNNRQAKQLDNLYNLIEKENWKTLKGLIQEFQECEKQLQKEWGTYGDFE